MAHKVIKCKAPPAGFKDDVIVLVTFVFDLADHDKPVEVTRGVKRGEGNWRHYPVLDVMGPAKVKLHDVPLVQGKDNVYLQLPNINIPREVAQAVIHDAMMMDTPATDVAETVPPERAA